MAQLSPKEKYVEICRKMSCNVNTHIMRELPDTVEVIRGVKTLDFSRSMLGKSDVEPLVEAILRHCSSLKVLNLSQNYLTDDSIVRICEALLVNSPHLVSLNLSNNPLSNKTGRYLLRFIDSMPLLQSVEVHRTLMSDNILRLFSQPCRKTSSLVSRHMAALAFTDAAVPVINPAGTPRENLLCNRHNSFKEDAQCVQYTQQWSALQTLWRAAAVAAPTSDNYSSLRKLISLTRINQQNDNDVYNEKSFFFSTSKETK